MDSHLLEKLLNEDESSALDFKQDQYPFIGATDERKGELLKDILAFANAWRRSEAYILIGIKEHQGARAEILGTSNHLSESDLQQFVNSKTQRPVQFSYETHQADGKSIGIIRIPIQQRPLYLEKDYGKLQANAVYIRRGSSTGIAKPDEVASMRLEDAQLPPMLSVDFSHQSLRQALGKAVSFTSTLLQTTFTIPDYPPGVQQTPLEPGAIPLYNRNYLREKAFQLAINALTSPFRIMLHNTGTIAARNVKVVCTFPTTDQIRILDQSTLPKEPRKENVFSLGDLAVPAHHPQQITVENNAIVSAIFPIVRPGESVVTQDAFWIGTLSKTTIEVPIAIYAENLAKPIADRSTFDISTVPRNLELTRFGGDFTFWRGGFHAEASCLSGDVSRAVSGLSPRGAQS